MFIYIVHPTSVDYAASKYLAMNLCISICISYTDCHLRSSCILFRLSGLGGSSENSFPIQSSKTKVKKAFLHFLDCLREKDNFVSL